MPWKHSEATDETPGFIAALEERYSSHGRGITATERFAEGNPLDPVVTSCVDNITRLPTHDDYPLWRVRCKVILAGVSFVYVTYIFYSSNP